MSQVGRGKVRRLAQHNLARRSDQLPRLVFRRFLLAELVLQLRTPERLRKSSAAARSARLGRECARVRTRTGVCGDV
jgi:hypothetical protein